MKTLSIAVRTPVWLPALNWLVAQAAGAFAFVGARFPLDAKAYARWQGRRLKLIVKEV